MPQDTIPSVSAPGLSWLAAWLLLAVPLVHAQPFNGDVSFAGAASCGACHEREYRLWRNSHHDLAMQEAGPDAVLGDFDDATFSHFGVDSLFYRSDERFMVRTDGPEGTLRDYPVAYTFGIYPLQQYLIELEGGRLQALDIAWDSRELESGGQRWIHLHPREAIRAGDPLHWAGPNLNWNYMCADCHSTSLRKNYDAGSHSYNTTWAEIDVACEACHGPGSEHVDWARNGAAGTDSGNMGLQRVFGARAERIWPAGEPTATLRQSGAPWRTAEIQVCARCHSRRGQLTDDVTAADEYLDGFRPSLLSPGNYHADGSVAEEVYVWGSFLQSRMYQAGVRCSDCHEPHSGLLRIPGDGVCGQCHAPASFASREHHFHEPGTPGSDCRDCHMPPTTYMVVDERHEHGFRVPDPALSAELGTPNACQRCHQDRDGQWAADRLREWYGDAAAMKAGYGRALHAAREDLPGAGDLLQAVLADSGQPAIVRATALSHLGPYMDRGAFDMLRLALADEHPLLRMGALAGLADTHPRLRLAALPLLGDERRAVRIEAARLLAALPRDGLPEPVQLMLNEGIAEYIAVQEFNGERPEAQLSLGGLYRDLGRADEAEAAYRRALTLQPLFVPAYVNLAQLLSDSGREAQAAGWLERGLTRVPDSADLHHALGLSEIRRGQPGEAMEHLAQAAELNPGSARYGYVYGVALESVGQAEQALTVLRENADRHPGHAETLHALVTYNRRLGRSDEARSYARRLQELLPEDPGVARLLEELDEAGS